MPSSSKSTGQQAVMGAWKLIENSWIEEIVLTYRTWGQAEYFSLVSSSYVHHKLKICLNFVSDPRKIWRNNPRSTTTKQKTQVDKSIINQLFQGEKERMNISKKPFCIQASGTRLPPCRNLQVLFSDANFEASTFLNLFFPEINIVAIISIYHVSK